MYRKTDTSTDTAMWTNLKCRLSKTGIRMLGVSFEFGLHEICNIRMYIYDALEK